MTSATRIHHTGDLKSSHCNWVKADWLLCYTGTKKNCNIKFTPTAVIPVWGEFSLNQSKQQRFLVRCVCASCMQAYRLRQCLMYIQVCVCPYQTDAASVELRTPGTLACLGVQSGSRHTAASRTCTAAECPAWRWSTPESPPPLHLLHTPCGGKKERKRHFSGESFHGDFRDRSLKELLIVPIWKLACDRKSIKANIMLGFNWVTVRFTLFCDVVGEVEHGVFDGVAVQRAKWRSLLVSL